MTLAEGRTGKEYFVEDMDLPLQAFMRLQALGMTKGTRLEVLNRKKKGALIFKVRGTRLAVGRRMAEKITIRSVNITGYQERSLS